MRRRWPGPTWASVDYYGRWKAAQYGYRHAFAPVMITGFVDEKQGTVQIKVASDLMRPIPARIEWRLTDLDGKILVQGQDALNLPGGTSAMAGPLLHVGEQLRSVGPEHAVLWLEVVAGAKSDSNVVFFTRPKNLNLVDPKIATRIVATKAGYDVTLTASAPALWVWLDCADPDARYTDNFVHLFPGEPKKIRVTPSKQSLGEPVQATLRARSLYDTYSNQ